ncbi:MAG: translation elongation factor Ts [Melioribacter sp.]|uniref:translation elongation factor Ts n=1 Tax=Rosettibacter primus TaxID=3111523 RepID=UPI00247D8F6B|nr:translation elongation factor Ts [Melioribacter sp.]
MAISATQVKELRDKTGAGMVDCKKALEEANGDFQKAIELLRKKGAAVAAKRAEKVANEGLILTRVFNNGSSAVIVEINCETDFVAKSEDFVNFANFVLDTLVQNKPADINSLLQLSMNGKNVQDELNALIGKIGEKIQISRFAFENVENGLIVDYIHHGSKLGVIVSAENVPQDKVSELQPILKDIAMQIAAMRPITIYRDEVDKSIIEKELEIYKELARKEGKPEQVLEKIAVGKLNKFYEENCLIEQIFVKDNSKKVGTLIEEFNKKNNSQVKLARFKRFHLSDEKK